MSNLARKRIPAVDVGIDAVKNGQAGIVLHPGQRRGNGPVGINYGKGFCSGFFNDFLPCEYLLSPDWNMDCLVAQFIHSGSEKGITDPCNYFGFLLIHKPKVAIYSVL